MVGGGGVGCGGDWTGGENGLVNWRSRKAEGGGGRIEGKERFCAPRAQDLWGGTGSLRDLRKVRIKVIWCRCPLEGVSVLTARSVYILKGGWSGEGTESHRMNH